MTIYLSPGDCHRYYSPANISISDRIYIPGFLAPVKPSYVLKHPKTFSLNERVTLRCKYKNEVKVKETKNKANYNRNPKEKDDVLFITLVGALNVGSINLSFDENLITNEKNYIENIEDESQFIVKYKDGVEVNKKDELGWFNFGSTIVLVFSEDKDKEIVPRFKEGEKIKIGETLFDVKKKI